MNRADSVLALPGVGERRVRTLRGMGIATVGDLLRHFPRDYDDRSEVKTVAMLTVGAVNTLRGRILAEPENVSFPSKRNGAPLIMTKARLRDDTGEVELVWFNRPYLKKYFNREREYVFTGKVTQAYNRLQIESPDYGLADAPLPSGGRIVPVYTIAASISQKMFRSYIHTALSQCRDAWHDDLPAALRAAHNLCDLSTAIQHIHFPESDGHFLAARRRLVFEELFFMQSALFQIKGAVSGQQGNIFPDTDTAPFWRVMPFTPTKAQEAVLHTLGAELRGGRRMNRLIQGDVGSGKTAVAMAAAYLAIKNGFQAAIMAPTEVLAQQHFDGFSRVFSALGIETVLLTSSLGAAARKAARAAIQSGRANMVVGTHALIQAGVDYNHLALVITDEQHRFGVNQRLTLAEKGLQPHTLVMTATPIPRTLGLILYGDMDISVIDELPPGRQTIKTYCVDAGYRPRLHAFIRREAAEGRQAYVICPAIEETEGETAKADLQNVLRYTQALQNALPGLGVAALHGRMKPAEKQAVMDDFKANKLQVLVATTVIEVGVHVANATLMIIENAERFGLSQLHQLRGRVGRGEAQSYCVLVTDARNEPTRSRMKAMTETSDGFRLSELDLSLRGAGDFFGVRQHGLPGFTMANLYRDMDILKEAQAAAEDVFQGKYLDAPDEKNRYTQRVFRVLDGVCSVL